MSEPTDQAPAQPQQSDELLEAVVSFITSGVYLARRARAALKRMKKVEQPAF